MNGTLGRLAGLYALNKDTVNGLAALVPSEEEAPTIDISGMTPGQIGAAVSQQTGGAPIQGPTNLGGPQPDVTPMAPPSVQGPAEPDFPTVKPMGDYASDASAAPTGQAQTVAAHWQPTTHERTQEGGMRPEYAQDYGSLRASQLQHETNADLLSLEDAKVRGISAGIQKQNEALVNAQTQDHLRNLAEQRQRYIEGQQQAAEMALADARKDVDPEAMWRGNTFGRVLAAIAVGLGQFGATLTKTENGALRIIDNAIAHNIDAQKTNIANARNRYRDLVDEKTRRLADFEDQKQQELVHKAMLLDDTARMVEEWNAKNGYKSQAQAEQILAGIQKRKADALKDYAAISDGKWTEKNAEKFVPQQTVGGAPDGKDHGELYVPTLGGYARSKEVAEKINAKGAQRMQIGESLREIHELLADAEKAGMTSPLQRADIDKRIQQRVSNVLRRSTVLEGQGAMSEGDKAVSEVATGLNGLSTQGMPSALIKRNMARVKDVANQMMVDHRIEGEANGIRKGQESYVAGPNGPKPVQKLEGRNTTISKRTTSVDDLVVAPKGVPGGR